jgi:all-trans-retinol 13,14-reductase
VKKRQTYAAVMTSLRDLIPDVDRYIRMKIYGTPTTSEHFWGNERVISTALSWYLARWGYTG